MMDGITTALTYDPLTAASAAESSQPAEMLDISAFGKSMQKAEAAGTTEEITTVTVGNSISRPLAYIDSEANEIAAFARRAIESDKEMTPGEIVFLTAKSHEFMFHAQLTANVANRTSEGLQQLFRQQG